MKCIWLTFDNTTYLYIFDLTVHFARPPSPLYQIFSLRSACHLTDVDPKSNLTGHKSSSRLSKSAMSDSPFVTDIKQSWDQNGHYVLLCLGPKRFQTINKFHDQSLINTALWIIPKWIDSEIIFNWKIKISFNDTRHNIHVLCFLLWFKILYRRTTSFINIVDITAINSDPQISRKRCRIWLAFVDLSG